MRLLADRGAARARPTRGARLGPGTDRGPPGHALAADRKSLLQDAAVVGKVFWAGASPRWAAATHARSTRPARAVAQGAHPSRPHAARWRARQSSASGTCWFGTSATRRSRGPGAPPHLRPPPGSSARRANGWRTSPRCSPTTTRLRSSSPGCRPGRAGARARRHSAIRFLALAAERALVARRRPRRAELVGAVGLVPPCRPERAQLLERWAQAAHLQGRLEETRDALEEALAFHREQGERVAAGRALTRARARPPHPWATRHRQAIAEAPGAARGPAARARSSSPRTPAWHPRASLPAAYPEAIAAAERALALAAELRLPEPAGGHDVPRAGHAAHSAKRQGLEDLRRAAPARPRAGSGPRGRQPATTTSRSPPGSTRGRRRPRAPPGRDRLLRAARPRRARAPGGAPGSAAAPRRGRPARAGAGRGRPAGGPLGGRRRHPLHRARAPPARPVHRAWRARPRPGRRRRAPSRGARDSGEPQYYAAPLATAAGLLLAQGPVRSRHERCSLELEQVPNLRPSPYYASGPAPSSSALRSPSSRRSSALGSSTASSREHRSPSTLSPPAALPACRSCPEPAEAAGLYAGAAERWREFGNVPERAYALLGQGRSLAALDLPERRTRRCARPVSCLHRSVTGQRWRKRRHCSDPRRRLPYSDGRVGQRPGLQADRVARLARSRGSTGVCTVSHIWVSRVSPQDSCGFSTPTTLRNRRFGPRDFARYPSVHAGSEYRQQPEWPREESNLRPQIRSLPLYPLSYGASRAR